MLFCVKTRYYALEFLFTYLIPSTVCDDKVNWVEGIMMSWANNQSVVDMVEATYYGGNMTITCPPKMGLHDNSTVQVLECGVNDTGHINVQYPTMEQPDECISELNIYHLRATR